MSAPTRATIAGRAYLDLRNLLTTLFLEINSSPFRDAQPDIDVPMVEQIAAGQATQDEILAWLSERTEHP